MIGLLEQEMNGVMVHVSSSACGWCIVILIARSFQRSQEGPRTVFLLFSPRPNLREA